MLCTAIYILPYCTKTRNHEFYFLQHLHYSLAMCSCCGLTLFDVIIQKRVKHSMARENVRSKLVWRGPSKDATFDLILWFFIMYHCKLSRNFDFITNIDPVHLWYFWTQLVLQKTKKPITIIFWSSTKNTEPNFLLSK